jgi:E3 ubiquitin-protein ligase EDD1
LFSVDPLQPNATHTTSESERLSISESTHMPTQRLEEDSSRVTSDSRRASGFAAANDEGGETEGDQDGEEGMDEGEHHDNEADGADVDEQAPGGGQGVEAMAIGEGGEQESDMELDLLAESESDSDDNQSNLNDTASSAAQRSIQTRATAGSEAGGGVANLALFSEDDSDESTQQVNIVN